MDAARLGLGLLGGVILAASVHGARHPTIHPREVRVFEAINGLPGWLYWPLWPPMQLGNLVVGTAVGLAVAWWQHDWPIAIGVVLAMALKLVAERVVRHRMAGFSEVRQRPGTSEPNAVLRGGDVPTSGASFPSGHVVLVAAVSIVVTNDLPVAVAWVPLVCTAAVMVGRVYVGAHNPLDVTAGLGLGLLVGAIVDVLLS